MFDVCVIPSFNGFEQPTKASVNWRIIVINRDTTRKQWRIANVLSQLTFINISNCKLLTVTWVTVSRLPSPIIRMTQVWTLWTVKRIRIPYLAPRAFDVKEFYSFCHSWSASLYPAESANTEMCSSCQSYSKADIGANRQSTRHAYKTTRYIATHECIG